MSLLSQHALAKHVHTHTKVCVNPYERAVMLHSYSTTHICAHVHSQVRYFVLVDGVLSYYTTRDDMHTGSRGSVRLSAAHVVGMSFVYVCTNSFNVDTDIGHVCLCTA
jgi:hypothetical protein